MLTPEAEPDPAAIHSAFARLHPGVQRQLWRMKWSHLRPLQVDAIHAILDTEKAVLVSAATASGKTEAAFLPILSQLAAVQGTSVQVLYVGPLRALINDQFTRVGDLCEHLDMAVHHWHGDVSAAAKRNLIKQPSGVLLLTPESLESLFINRSPHLPALFKGLRFIVVDELHVFLGTERGRQLQSLLSRLAACCEATPRRIGLSATLGHEAAARHAASLFLSPAAPEELVWIEDASPKPLGYRIHTYLEPAKAIPDESNELIVERQIAADIARHFAHQTSLIFANARGDVEAYADLCQPQMPNTVCVHHGSLAREIREETEERLKAQAKSTAVTAFCSSTLELGVDLGDVAAVGQIGPPPTVASLKQRLGRSGRGEGQTRVLRVFLPLEEPAGDAEFFARLHLPLIQTIAATELMLEGWVEPPVVAHYDLSTLTQQILSVIAQTGGVSATALHEVLCRNGAFSPIEPPLFMRLLRCLGNPETDVIEQTPTGELILGLRGETIRHSRDFYAVFPTPREHALLHEGRLLGQLPISWTPTPGEHLLFAGRRWQVLSIDEARHQIHVAPAHGKKRPSFSGDGMQTHAIIRRKMREVLLSQADYSYLDSGGATLLLGARLEAARAGAANRALLELGANRTALMLWTGDRLDTTVRLLLQSAGAEVEADRSARGVAIVCRHDTQKLRALIERACQLEITAMELAAFILNKKSRKYDWLLDDALLEEALAVDLLDVDAARDALATTLAGPNVC